ncbi:hypothetical protein [Roseicyclus marinus]|uniref:hypothetical protein n=1 Tax=Roseicyclus marinus TaxID=2161673 RepID=UPI00240EC474|nr:hypothetical protein [Roseicyclus marinus]MDG3040980.1 hypothetical protein [Roseicyclus marinus]
MFWSLVTALFAGFAGAGVGLILRTLTRQRLPKGIIPICAGLAMLASTVALEYGWQDGTRSSMPEDLVVISTRQQQAWYQPWTLIRPWVRGFIGYAPSETAETAPGSGIRVVQLRIQERWQPQVIRPVLVDCDNARWADLNASTQFTETGQPIDLAWRETGTADPVVGTVCGREAANG